MTTPFFYMPYSEYSKKRDCEQPFILPELGKGTLRKFFYAAATLAALSYALSIASTVSQTFNELSVLIPPATVETREFNWHMRCSVPNDPSEKPFLFSTINYNSDFAVPVGHFLSPYDQDLTTTPVFVPQHRLFDGMGTPSTQIMGACFYTFNGVAQWADAESVAVTGTREEIPPHPDFFDLSVMGADDWRFVPSLGFSQ